MNEEVQPLVTIIVPCYNHEKYVTSTIESIVNQTYKNIEILVIDDGSYDNSPVILEELSNKYGFYYAHQKNIGLSATLNKAIKMAKGKYVSVIASDDINTLDKIEILVNEFEKLDDDYAVVCGDALFIGDNDSKITLKKDNKEFTNFVDYYIFGRHDIDVAINFGEYGTILKRNYIPCVGLLIKKQALFDVGLFEEDICLEDWNMWLKLSKQYNIKYIDKVVAFYRSHENNSQKKIHNRLALDVINILEREKKYCVENCFIKIWRKRYYDAITYLRYSKQYRQYIKKVLKNNIFLYAYYEFKKLIIRAQRLYENL